MFSGKCTALLHIGPKPPVVPRYKKEVILSASITALDRGGDIGSQHDLGQDQDVFGEDNDYCKTVTVRLVSGKELID